MVIFQGDQKVLLGDMVRILQIAKLAGAATDRDRGQARRAGTDPAAQIGRARPAVDRGAVGTRGC